MGGWDVVFTAQPNHELIVQPERTIAGHSLFWNYDSILEAYDSQVIINQRVDMSTKPDKVINSESLVTLTGFSVAMARADRKVE